MRISRDVYASCAGRHRARTSSTLFACLLFVWRVHLHCRSCVDWHPASWSDANSWQRGMWSSLCNFCVGDLKGGRGRSDELTCIP